MDSSAQYNLKATAELLADAENTPCSATRSKHAHTSSRPFSASRRSFSSVTATSSSTSVSAAASSPCKLLAELNIGNHAVDSHPLSLASVYAHRLPVPLVALLEDLENVATGCPIVSAALQPDFDRLAAHQSVRRRPNTIYAPTPERNAVGPYPPLDNVLALLAEAEQCNDRKQSEASWNAAMHFPLLRLAVHGQGARKSQLVDVEMCTTASIIKEYHCMQLLTSKKVDMAMIIEPTANETNSTEAVKRINILRTRSPCFSINHTNFELLLQSLIAISIETKHPSASGEDAALQVSVWQAAQWSLLQSLTQPQPTSSSSIALLAFLPAITVVSHD
ncbi:hypothetical protein M406DRAFT_253406 [Cryphonectria parasitica EP155]|uniref:PD-(D/E)XK nuclease-like domain-containing protein n=1 Tax=Cryphonectria parasitica (strain ATCC 38755 / EP155) TaxID=660469 RepID=A0A9P5CRE3_CRYP1|nr:uncharacterized protein M406DRAFT_253406 [Cryphonectria parasitica EP155]KAF3768168.1 hypothetical protein M406DRAFT_253406 [Cryphonectria parasitica EP155]